jgi:hypothetical protein
MLQFPFVNQHIIIIDNPPHVPRHAFPNQPPTIRDSLPTNQH